MKISFRKLIDLELKPKKIKCSDVEFEWTGRDYYADNKELFLSDILMLDEMKEKNIEIPEEKKIELPEKLEIEQDTPNSNYYIKNEFGTKCCLTKHSKMIADKLNETLDYLKYKEEEKEK